MSCHCGDPTFIRNGWGCPVHSGKAIERVDERERAMSDQPFALTDLDAAIWSGLRGRAAYREQEERDFMHMRYAQRNPRVCASNYIGEACLYGGRAQR